LVTEHSAWMAGCIFCQRLLNVFDALNRTESWLVQPLVF